MSDFNIIHPWKSHRILEVKRSWSLTLKTHSCTVLNLPSSKVLDHTDSPSALSPVQSTRLEFEFTPSPFRVSTPPTLRIGPSRWLVFYPWIIKMSGNARQRCQCSSPSHILRGSLITSQRTGNIKGPGVYTHLSVVANQGGWYTLRWNSIQESCVRVRSLFSTRKDWKFGRSFLYPWFARVWFPISRLDIKIWY